MTTRLISFVGTSDYREVGYFLPEVPEQRVVSRYVAKALATLLKADEIGLLATEEAWKANGERLQHELTEIGVSVHRHPIPTGKDIGELRQQFRALRDALSGLQKDDTLIVDITHSFRHQPFFASSTLAVMQASGDLPSNTRILYGALEAGKRNDEDDVLAVPIFELTSFLSLQHVAFGIATFLHTGHAASLVQALREEEDRLRTRALAGEREGFPGREINVLIGALERFARDLSCLRVPAITIGSQEGGKHRKSSSALLAGALQAYERAEKDELIAIRPLLDDLLQMVLPLQASTLYGAEGQRVMAELCQCYLMFYRYAEAAGLGAEALISRYASGPEGTDAGHPVFSESAREQAAARCKSARENRGRLGFRNDILHAGFRPAPDTAETLEDNIHKLAGIIATPPRTIFVTRHAGAREWAKRQGIIVDEVAEHLDPECINPGDLVIGSLPVHLVAEICRRGGRYKHLSMDIPPGHRGQELSADDMERFGARLEEFRVETIRTSAGEAEA